VPEGARDTLPAEQDFVAEVVRGMAALRAAPGDDGQGRDDLSLPLGLSAWVARAAMGLPDAYAALLGLRSAVVEAAGMHRTSEPVPMRLADPRASLRNLGAYLYELLGRAARHAGVSEVELAERTLAHLEAGEPARPTPGGRRAWR
jgi:hypothetical protein